MRVLMTGATGLQIGEAGGPTQKINVPRSIVAALESNGHTVDWRRVTPGEDLSRYDVVWCNLAPVHSLNARRGALGMLWALNSGLPCVGFFDDWQFKYVFRGAQAITRNPAMLYKYLLTGAADRKDVVKTHYSHASVVAEQARARDELGLRLGIDKFYSREIDDQVKPHERDLIAQCFALAAARWERGMVPVMPMYRWGDRSIVRDKHTEPLSGIEALDPSPTIAYITDTIEAVDPGSKTREWALGSIQPHDDWVARIKPDWTVAYIGSKTAIRRNGGVRYGTEQEVAQRYSESWGVLSPPYPQAGSGWWRSRFIYAALGGSVLLADPRETAALGDAYQHSVAEIEAMPTDDLAQLARDQADALLKFSAPIDTFVSHCNAIVDRAVREDRGWDASGCSSFQDDLDRAIEKIKETQGATV